MPLFNTIYLFIKKRRRDEMRGKMSDGK
jgi:hypothetical protein